MLEPFARRAGLIASDRERALLGLVHRHGLIGRAELSERLGLATQSVSRLVDGLGARGLVQLGERVIRRGNPNSGFGVELVPDGVYTLGVSLMTDALSVVLLNLRGEVLATHREPLPDVRIVPTLARVAELARDMFDRHVPDRQRILGVGLAVPGFFVQDRHVINPPPPLDDFALVDLPSLLAERLGLDVMLENDANAAAVAESFLGVGRRHASFGYVHCAAGVGGGVVLDGQLARGRNGNAGEVAGVLPWDLHDDRPSLSLLLKMVQAAGVEVGSLNELLDRFDPDMPGVAEWIERVRRPLDMIISSLGSVLDPDVIVLGGRMPRSLAERLIPSIRAFNVPRRAQERPLPAVVPAEVLREPTAIGAAVLPLKQHLFG